MWRANIRKLFIKGENKELNLKVFNGIPEAPADGEQYVRKDRYWRKIEGAIDVDTEVTETSENAVKSSGIWTFVTGLWDSLSQWVTGTFVSQANEDKGSVAKQEHEQEYDHEAFLTSVPPIPSDISDLTDTQDIIPPHLFFDDQYFSGEGTQVDPKSLRVENLPSGGGGAVVNTYAFTTTDRLRGFTLTKFDRNVDFEMNDGDVLAISYNYNLISSTTGEGLQGIVYLRLRDGQVNLYEKPLDYNQSTHQGAIVLQRVGNTLLCVYYRTNSSYDSIVRDIVFNFDFDSFNTIYIGTGSNNQRFAEGGKFYFTKK